MERGFEWHETARARIRCELIRNTTPNDCWVRRTQSYLSVENLRLLPQEALRSVLSAVSHVAVSAQLCGDVLRGHFRLEQFTLYLERLSTGSENAPQDRGRLEREARSRLFRPLPELVPLVRRLLALLSVQSEKWGGYVEHLLEFCLRNATDHKGLVRSYLCALKALAVSNTPLCLRQLGSRNAILTEERSEPFFRHLFSWLLQIPDSTRVLEALVVRFRVVPYCEARRAVAQDRPKETQESPKKSSENLA